MLIFLKQNGEKCATVVINVLAFFIRGCKQANQSTLISSANLEKLNNRQIEYSKKKAIIFLK